MIPFLVQFADPSEPESEPEHIAHSNTGSEDEPDINVDWFHTRCGHPRHRDD
jgi:hypothetical protein